MAPIHRRLGVTTVALLTFFGLTTQEALASTYFTYTIDFKASLRGRNMSGHTDYCNYFTATFHEPGFDPTITIRLKQDVFGTDPSFNAVSYPTDGGTYFSCWRGFNSGDTYYFQYTKNNNTKTVRGNGSVRDN